MNVDKQAISILGRERLWRNNEGGNGAGNQVSYYCDIARGRFLTAAVFEDALIRLSRRISYRLRQDALGIKALALLPDQRSNRYMGPVNTAKIQDHPLDILQLQGEAAIALLHGLDPERRGHSCRVRIALEVGDIVNATAQRIGGKIGGDL
jgi:hypothetical protein